MGNIGNTIKRFLSNKNTVTLLAIIVGTVVLYFVYNWRLNNAISTVQACYATQNLAPRTLITPEMVTEREILKSQATENMVTSCDNVVGKYVSYATEIAQNSNFYTINLMTKEEMPDSAFDDIPDGYTIYNFRVSFESTYGNSIFPGDYIDLYLKTEDANGLLIYGKLIQSIQVAAVKDDQGQNVFETTVETRTPTQLLFSVPDDLYLLLKKAEFLDFEVVIVPRNNNYTAKAGEVLVSSEYLKNMIMEKTAEIPDECIENVTGTAECKINETTEDNSENQPAE